MVQASDPVVVHVLLWIMLTEPATNRLSSGLRVPFHRVKIGGLPLVPVLEAILLSTRCPLESIRQVSDILPWTCWIRTICDLPKLRMHPSRKWDVVLACQSKTCTQRLSILHCLCGSVGRVGYKGMRSVADLDNAPAWRSPYWVRIPECDLVINDRVWWSQAYDCPAFLVPFEACFSEAIQNFCRVFPDGPALLGLAFIL